MFIQNYSDNCSFFKFTGLCYEGGKDILDIGFYLESYEKESIITNRGVNKGGGGRIKGATLLLAPPHSFRKLSTPLLLVCNDWQTCPAVIT